MGINFEGNVKKNERSFKPQQRASDGAGVGRVVAGVYPGQDPIVTFEKADQPVEPTTPYGRTDGAGESELGLSGEVSHPDNSGGAKYVDAASVIRQSIARLSGVSGSHKAISALSALADQLEGKSVSSFVHKRAGGLEILCPHCAGPKQVDRNSGMQKYICGSCGKDWMQDVSLSILAKSTPGSPDLEALRKQLLTLSENIRAILARRAGVDPMAGRRTGQDSGERFVTKAAGSGGTTAEEELHKALANGTPVQFSGQDPRDTAAKSGGRRFQPRD